MAPEVITKSLAKVMVPVAPGMLTVGLAVTTPPSETRRSPISPVAIPETAESWNWSSLTVTSDPELFVIRNRYSSMSFWEADPSNWSAICPDPWEARRTVSSAV